MVHLSKAEYIIHTHTHTHTHIYTHTPYIFSKDFTKLGFVQLSRS